MNTVRRDRDVLLVYETVQRVMSAESIGREAGLDVDVVPAPRAVSSECGMVLVVPAADGPALEDALRAAAHLPHAVYRRRGELWMPGALAARETAPVDALTQKSAYGGCGAKLSKGLLHSILCGLPRTEHPDLIVGIETADDAGVMRVSPEIGIVHTVDFFPPIVDDPFTFGRIAAANALSDVYAMGGTPLAGMNLVSFPLASYERDVLKEILRGGLDALEESGAALAGGHTIEGQELLYGLAVTGVVHPDRVWRNDTARAGDALVLTKRLGTGVITTAAKAELAAPDHLSRAIRTMATLNKRAADAARRAAPHAVTDVTGFGLAGHAAEMASGAGLTVVIDVPSLPLLDGAYDAAASGLVPAGTGKNRASVADILDVPADLDPVLIDLVCDPQTSGGLLIACDPAAARDLIAELPGSAWLIGRCEAGDAGRVRLQH